MSIDAAIDNDPNVKNLVEVPQIEKSEVPFFPELGLDKELIIELKQLWDFTLDRNKVISHQDYVQNVALFGKRKINVNFESKIEQNKINDEYLLYKVRVSNNLKKRNLIDFSQVNYDFADYLATYSTLYGKNSIPELPDINRNFEQFYKIYLNKPNVYHSINYLPQFLINESVSISKKEAANHLDLIWPKFKEDIDSLFLFPNQKVLNNLLVRLYTAITSIRLLNDDKFKELNLNLVELNNQFFNYISSEKRFDSKYLLMFLGANDKLQISENGLKIKSNSEDKEDDKLRIAPLPDRRNF